MSAPAHARATFQRRLAELRGKKGVTQRWIASQLAQLGHDVAPQTVSGWERGSFAPDRPKAQALDQLLGAEGQLLDALGYSAEEESLQERVTALEEDRVELWGVVRELQARWEWVQALLKVERENPARTPAFDADSIRERMESEQDKEWQERLAAVTQRPAAPGEDGAEKAG